MRRSTGGAGAKGDPMAGFMAEMVMVGLFTLALGELILYREKRHGR